jgi:hypothetical protein
MNCARLSLDGVAPVNDMHVPMAIASPLGKSCKRAAAEDAEVTAFPSEADPSKR